MVSIIVLGILKRDLVLQISDSVIQGNLLHVIYVNVFTISLIITINERRNIIVSSMRN